MARRAAEYSHLVEPRPAKPSRPAPEPAKPASVVAAMPMLPNRRARAFNIETYAESNGQKSKLTFTFIPDSPSQEVFEEGRYEFVRFGTHIGYEEPPEGVVFATVCTDKYEPGLEALILSLMRVYPGLSNRFVVYHDGGLSPFNQRRLLSLYPWFDFQERSTDRYDVTMDNRGNHVRVGLLGYLSLEVFDLEADRVILLDSDVIILGDISPLWAGETINAVADAGFIPLYLVSEETNLPVINSGVISLPGSELGPEGRARADEVLANLDSCPCTMLNRFADQKFWNLFMARRPLTLLPQNFNANKGLVDVYAPEQLPNVSILHITGPKPWFSFIESRFTTLPERRGAARARGRMPISYALWDEVFGRELLRRRFGDFSALSAQTRARFDGAAQGETVVLIGNGPSLAETDMNLLEGVTTAAFNWFVHHPDFDRIAPNHLILPSHMLFGGWHNPEPSFPPGFLEALKGHAHKPHIWIPYYFKDLVDTSGELADYDVSYVFYEKPFKRPITDTGFLELDLFKPLTDANTGVLTVGVPLALHLGAARIVLIGCDGSYGQQEQTYFYDESKHTSSSTRTESLHKTWVPEGPGQFGYRKTREQLEARGVPLLDATVGGSLTVLEKIELAKALAES